MHSGQMTNEQIRENRPRGVSFAQPEKALLEEGSRFPEKRVMTMPVKKQNVPTVGFLNPVIHNWQ